jgi:hypothetical protein
MNRLQLFSRRQLIMKRNIKALKRLEGDLIVEEGEDDEFIK